MAVDIYRIEELRTRISKVVNQAQVNLEYLSLISENTLDISLLAKESKDDFPEGLVLAKLEEIEKQLEVVEKWTTQLTQLRKEQSSP